jgi:TolA-binding protein
MTSEIDQATMERCAEAASGAMSNWFDEPSHRMVYEDIARAVLAASKWGEEIERLLHENEVLAEMDQKQLRQFQARYEGAETMLRVQEQRVTALEAALRPFAVMEGSAASDERTLLGKMVLHAREALAAAPPAPASERDDSGDWWHDRKPPSPPRETPT